MKQIKIVKEKKLLKPPKYYNKLTFSNTEELFFEDDLKYHRAHSESTD